MVARVSDIFFINNFLDTILAVGTLYIGFTKGIANMGGR
jgi:hypothetical protein